MLAITRNCNLASIAIIKGVFDIDDFTGNEPGK